MSTRSAKVAGSNGSRSNTAQSGWLGASIRECHGCRSMTPAFATHASVATSLTTMYVLVFSPWYVHESIQPGAYDGLSLRQKDLPAMPSGNTCMDSGRSRRYGSRYGAMRV